MKHLFVFGTTHPFQRWEPILKRMVLALILTFLTLAAIGTTALLIKMQQKMLEEAAEDLILIADAFDHDLQNRNLPTEDELSVNIQIMLDLRAPQAARKMDAPLLSSTKTTGSLLPLEVFIARSAVQSMICLWAEMSARPWPMHIRSVT